VNNDHAPRNEDADHRVTTAHHEAGHVVATCLRGKRLVSVTIEPTDKTYGLTVYERDGKDDTFLVWAGVWAEARHNWPKPSLHETDSTGREFGDHVIDAWLLNRDGDLDEYTRLKVADPAKFTEQVIQELPWTSELEEMWPVIQVVAERLLDRQEVSTEVVTRLIARQKETLNPA
jgi:hypothetical protein